MKKLIVKLCVLTTLVGFGPAGRAEHVTTIDENSDGSTAVIVDTPEAQVGTTAVPGEGIAVRSKTGLLGLRQKTQIRKSDGTAVDVTSGPLGTRIKSHVPLIGD